MLRSKYQLLLLVAFILAAYYPAVFADFSRIDDAQLAETYRGMQNWSFWQEFMPFAQGGLYYRPLIGLSYVIDKFFLGLSPGLMHLENVLLHLLNTVLVYLLTIQIIPAQNRKNSPLPAIAAFLFGLHPINTESVNWISGRTDVLAGTFILTSSLFLLWYRERSKKRYLIFSLLFFMAGTLTKETALAFLPGFLLMIYAPHTEDQKTADTTEPVVGTARGGKNLMFAALLVGASFLMLRIFAVPSSSSRIGMTLTFVFSDWMNTMLISLKALGFYMKKLIVPYPLNFAIMEIDPLYEIIAVPIVAICLLIACRKSLLSSVFTTGIFLIFPSFLIAFGQIAWTPYAERYLYMPSAFIVASSVVYFDSKIANYDITWKRISTFALLGIFFVSVFTRSLVWQKDITLCKDTVGKSPAAGNIRLVYSGLLAERGDYAEALKQLEQGKAIPYLAYDERYDLSIAHIYYKQGRIDDAISISEDVLKKTSGTSSLALAYLVDLLKIKRDVSSKNAEKKLLNKRILAYNAKRFEITRAPHLLYELAMTAQELREYSKARMLFRQAINNLPDDHMLKAKAKLQLEKTSEGRRR